MSKTYAYLSGFGNELSSEAVTGSLPSDRNNPQEVAMGLYAEQLSGSAFTAYPQENLRTWLYKITPSADHPNYEPAKKAAPHWLTPNVGEFETTPERLRWSKFKSPEKSPITFFESFYTVVANGDASQRTGSAVHLYAASKPMGKQAFCNHDGELLIVPQDGELRVQTELGFLSVKPTEIVVIPRGMKVRVDPVGASASGYVCENYGNPFVLPYRGPIGANGLASRRHFLTPVAAFEKSTPTDLLIKFQGGFWQTPLASTPFDVVGWYGNYVPYKYDLNLFNTMGTVSFDHPDPSIFTVLTSPTERDGVANVDFVIFPPRWMVAENTFRPPYFHRNVMSEYMGLIKGIYDAKPNQGAEDGFAPGGGSLHNCMTAHGPERMAYDAATRDELKPQKLENTLAFMFESSWVYTPSKQALHASFLQKNYAKCWQGFESNFKERR